MRSFGLLFLLTTVLLGCKKYPEGPAFTLRSKEERLANNWVIDKYLENDNDLTESFKSAYPAYLLVVGKSGTYALTYDGVNTQTGTWRLANNAKNWETLDNTSTAVAVTYTILRLKEKSFWCTTTDVNGVKKEFRYKPQ